MGRIRMLLMSVFFSLVFMAVAIFFSLRGCSQVQGTLVAGGFGPEGGFTFRPESCQSGQRQGFFGIVLLGDGPAAGAVLLVEDPDQGPIVTIKLPGSCPTAGMQGCAEVVIRPDQCTVFERAVRNTETRINNLTLREGHLRMQCAMPDIGTLEAHLEFEGCG